MVFKGVFMRKRVKKKKRDIDKPASVRGQSFSRLQIEVGLALLNHPKPVWASVLLNEVAPDGVKVRGCYGRALSALYNRRLVRKRPDHPGLPPKFYKVELNDNGLELFECLRSTLDEDDET